MPHPAAQFSRSQCLPHSRTRTRQIFDRELRSHAQVPGTTRDMGPVRFIIF